MPSVASIACRCRIVLLTVLAGGPGAAAQAPRPPVVERFEWIGSPIGTLGPFPSGRISETGIVFGSTRSPIQTTVRFAGVYANGSWNTFGPPTTDGGISIAGLSGEVERPLSETEHGYPSHAFRIQPGNRAPHGREASSEGGGINATGVSTGRYYTASRCASHPYRWSDAGFDVLSFLPDCSWGIDINDGGQIAGALITGDEVGTVRAFVVQPNNAVVYLPGSGIGHGVSAINNRGLVAGSACGMSSEGGCTFDLGFVWNPETQRVDYLPMLPGDNGFSLASDLDDAGRVVGHSRDCTAAPDGCDRAVVWIDGVAIDLAPLADAFLRPGSLLLQAHSIANSGWITGIGIDGGERYQFFRLKLADPNTYVVNRPDDLHDADTEDGACDADGDAEGLQCTLRAALEQANAAPGRQKIVFAITDEGAPPPSMPVIDVLTPLPAIRDSLAIDARTQPLWNTVRIDGAGAGAVTDGLVVDADSVTLDGLTVVRFGGHGLVVDGGRGVYLRSLALGADRDNREDTTLANGLAALRIDGTPERVVVGRAAGDPEAEAPPNELLGPISIAPSARAEVAIRLGNRLRLRPGDAAAARVALVDLGGDGPTCTPWTPVGPTSPTPPPRLLHQPGDGSGATAFEGRALPGSRVVLWRVEALPAGHGRYFARDVTAVAEDSADAEGAFAIEASLSHGTRFTLGASVPGRGPSELAQARRPVVVLPGIGGTSLVDAASGAARWLPLGAFPNDRLAAMALPDDGRPDGRLRTDGLVEPFGTIYGPMTQAFVDAGYPGDVRNAAPETLDLWRFANDWRLSPGLLADSLHAFVDRLTVDTETPGDAARACEVDLAAHSNGGVIAGVYVQRDRAHARDRIHRLVTSGTPYLGAVQALAGHTVGYIFDLDKSASALFPFDVEWGRMLTMTRNVPGAYMLLPSPGYFAAADPARPANADNAVLVDLYNEGLASTGTLRAFLAEAQADAAGVPFGLGRNAGLFDEQTALHERLGDWRAYDGPPQIHRLVGELPASTAVAWRLAPGPESLAPSATSRSTPGDTDRHRAYRERLRPVLGFGDGTVPLVSATLGRDLTLGRVDLSGVGQTPWIAEFERFACRHLPLVEPGCPDAEGDGPDALARLVEIIESGSVVRFSAGGGGGSARAFRRAGGHREVLYVSGTAGLRVSVRDAADRLTGRADTSAFVSRQIPGVDFEETALGATLGLESDAAYTVEATAPEGATVYATRVAVDGVDGSGEQALFAPVSVGAGGRVRIVFGEGGTPLSASLSVDATGDGLFESSAAPAAMLTGGAAPLLPLPRPALATATGAEGDTTRRVATIDLPEAGAGWTWSLSGADPWITPDADSGSVPATLRLDLRATALPSGMARDTLTLRLENGGFVYETPVFVAFDVGDPLPVELVGFSATLDRATARLAWTTESESDNAGFSVEHRAPGAGAWREVGFVSGHGTTAERHTYAYAVPGLVPGRHVFRLRQIDTDGTATMGPEATLNMGIDGALYAEPLAPSPVRGEATMRVIVASPGRVRADVYDVLGRHVARVYDGAVESDVVVRLNSSEWAPGLYVVRVETGGASSARPFTVVR